jgi:tRNA C32,U32 (ribose-2'-O)-methylase TrmJ
LANEELALCDIVVTIPANPENPILNVSHAAAVIFYEVYRACAHAKPPARAR